MNNLKVVVARTRTDNITDIMFNGFKKARANMSNNVIVMSRGGTPYTITLGKRSVSDDYLVCLLDDTGMLIAHARFDDNDA
jgi:hypothetical protein